MKELTNDFNSEFQVKEIIRSSYKDVYTRTVNTEAVILATQKAESRKIMVRCQPQTNSSRDPILKKKKA
jgi:hypothetical protein